MSRRRSVAARSAVARSAAGLLALAFAVGAGAAQPGWLRVELPGGSYAYRYLPQALAGEPGPIPAVVFLHGAGGFPEAYRPWVVKAADAAGLAAVVPKSLSNLGWGVSGDRETVEEALAVVGAELGIDPDRVTLAGHSAGGAYAYLLTYADAFPARAVFTLSAPFYAVSDLDLAEPGRVPPIRMYYGATDPNYTGGAYQALLAQWARLGVAEESDLRAGYGHNSWPQDAFDAGFLFLAAAATGCGGDGDALCLRDGRFRVEVEWHDFSGGSGPGRVVPGAADASGLFWFFSPANWELMVKVLDGCALNGHYWVFAAGTTNVEYTLTVTDAASGEEWSFTNPPGRPAPAVTDTAAFDACP